MISVFYKSAWGANAKMMSYYMVYGYVSPDLLTIVSLTRYTRGTSWGGLPFPEVYSTFD